MFEPLGYDGRPVDESTPWHTEWDTTGNVVVGMIADTNGTTISCNVTAFSVQLTRCELSAVGAPAGAPIVVDILKSVDAGTTATSLFAASQRPQIAPGQHFGAAFVSGAFNSGDFIQAEVVSVGSTTPGCNLSVRLTGRQMDS